jgi:hypothetical protein
LVQFIRRVLVSTTNQIDGKAGFDPERDGTGKDPSRT